MRTLIIQKLNYWAKQITAKNIHTMANPVVKIKPGLVKGAIGIALNGDKFFKFLGIPFAKPPVERLRFKDPIPVDSWQDIKDCTEPGDMCIQRNEQNEVDGSEDCLHLNVFTKELPKSKNKILKPVMVWIHGGGFLMGSNTPIMYGPEYLMSEDIVLVSINYRLGLLGFLRVKNDKNENIGGNMAFKDQLEALKWVKTNIENFNGDPNNVTIFGESAGAVSVHYHVISPKSRGYFNKAIIQSGAALDPWGDAGSEGNDHCAKEIAKYAGIDVSSEEKALEALQNVPAETIIEAQRKYLRTTVSAVVRPCVEKPSESAFLTKKPIDLISSGEYTKVPMIFGYNNMEGLLFASDLFKVPKLNVKNKIPFKTDPALLEKMVDKLEKFYFEGKATRKEGEIDLMSDSDFIFGIVSSVENHVMTSSYPVYLYKMTLDTELNFFKRFTNQLNYPGAAHADDLGYLFKTAFNPDLEQGTDNFKYVQNFVKLWTNFAIYGNPTPPQSKEPNIVWRPATPKELTTLVIDKELTIEVNPDKKRMDFWKELYRLHPNTAWSKAWSKL